MLTRVQRGNSVFAELDVSGSMDEIDELSLLMINSNQNKKTGLAPIRIDELNGRFEKIYFDVTGKVTLSEYLVKRVSQEAFKQMILHLIDTIENFDEYMIDVKQVVLDINSVFINEVDHTVAFICIPTKSDNSIGDLYEFFKAIVDVSLVDVSGNDNRVSYFNGACNVVRDKNGFSLQNMKMQLLQQQEQREEVGSIAAAPKAGSDAAPEGQMVKEADTVTVKKREKAVAPIVPQAEDKPDEQESKSLFGKLFKSGGKKKSTSDGFQGGIGKYKNADAFSAPSQKQQAPSPKIEIVQQVQKIQQQPKPAQDMDLGTITFHDKNKESFPSGDAVNNDNTDNAQAILVRRRDQSRISINKPVFAIGREREDQDYCINDNFAVGRIHASIIKKADRYYVVDLNSKNHTFVNGTKLEPNKEHMLNNGDKIVFANEEFDFRIV